MLAASAPDDFDDLGDGFVAGKRAKMRRSVGFSDGISPKRSECSDMLIGTAQGGQVNVLLELGAVMFVHVGFSLG